MKALHLAAFNDNLDILCQIEVHKTGAIDWSMDQEQLWAYGRGYIKIVQLLFEKRAEVNAQGGKHGTALQAAAQRRRLEVVQYSEMEQMPMLMAETSAEQLSKYVEAKRLHRCIRDIAGVNQN
jgi:hypothetical protein